jgi:hypothetical protein
VHERTAPERGAPAASMPSRASWTKRAALVAGVVAAAVLALAFDVRVEIGGSPAVADVPAGSERPVVRGVSVSRPTEVPKSTEPSKGKSASGGQTARPRAKQPVAAAHKPKARARNAGAKSKRGSQQQAGRRFSWAPVPRASAYYIEFFRGSARVFAATTRRAEVAVPRQWRFGGRVQKLAPGDYRWYVWPVFGETGRAPAASVQARLRIK